MRDKDTYTPREVAIMIRHFDRLRSALDDFNRDSNLYGDNLRDVMERTYRVIPENVRDVDVISEQDTFTVQVRDRTLPAESIRAYLNVINDKTAILGPVI